MLVEFEGVREMVCFKEDEISCMKLYHITCIDANANSKRVAIELETRAREIWG